MIMFFFRIYNLVRLVSSHVHHIPKNESHLNFSTKNHLPKKFLQSKTIKKNTSNKNFQPGLLITDRRGHSTQASAMTMKSRTFASILSIDEQVKKKVYIETYGCQMNFSDTEIITSILSQTDFEPCEEPGLADVIFLNTCSIRDHAEQRVLNRLQAIKALKKRNPHLVIGVLGCMAERLKEQLMEQRDFIDLVVGPDAYRDLPDLISFVRTGKKGINVMLSAEETYADITPVRADEDGITAFISIMRGCQNFCAYCVVPYTRGKERSRDPETIFNEGTQLFQNGYRDITLLGQNVNSYRWDDITFPKLMDRMATIHPDLRIRFATSHPKDLSDALIDTIAAHPNICKSIHLPLQSGSNRILDLMNRKYTREYYLERVEAIRSRIPECSLTTDLIAGFCTETPADHEDTLEMMRTVRFDYAFMFKYSERPDTLAAEKYADDVPEEIKTSRLAEIIALQQKLSLESNRADIGKTFRVLVEKKSKRSKIELSGRNSQNKMIVFPDGGQKPGTYAEVLITKCTAATLMGKVVNNPN